MKIQFDEREGCLQVRIRGRVDEAHCRCLEHFFSRHLSDQRSVVIDLREVDAIDDQGQRVLSAVVEDCRQHGIQVELVRPTPNTNERLG